MSVECTVYQTAYNACGTLPNTGPSISPVVLALIGLSLLLVGCGLVVLRRDDEAYGRALEAAKRGHVA